jgi:hypothetical protein
VIGRIATAIAETLLITALAIAKDEPALWWLAGAITGINVLHIALRIQRNRP